MIENKYDVIIVGAGPAGMTAGIYCARANLKTLIIEKKYPGGQIIITDEIENYPGFPEPLSGFELVQNFQNHLNKFDVEIKTENITDYNFDKKDEYIVSTDKNKYITKTVIIATGASPRKMGIPGENKFTGRGVSYCATCDAGFFKNKTVAVIGGGDTALEEALYLTKFVDKLYLVHRRDRFRAVNVLSDRVKNNNKIEPVLNSVPLEIKGDKTVECLQIKNKIDNKIIDIKVDGVFVFVGYIPNADSIPDNVKTTDSNYVIVNQKQETNIPGVFAAGDICDKYLRQVVTACGDGATAGFAAMRYIENY